MSRRKRRNETPSQRDHRRWLYMRDQHGRPWEMFVEDDTLCPVGEVKPMILRKGDRAGQKAWTPPAWPGRPLEPFLPPHQYMRFSEETVGQFQIDYDSWISDLRELHRQWRDNMTWYAQQMYPSDWGKAVKSLDKFPELARQAGAPPMAVECVLAAKKGNNWVLGLLHPDTKRPYPKPQWAMEFFPEFDPMTGPEFVDQEFPDVSDSEVREEENARREREKARREAAITRNARVPALRIDTDDDSDLALARSEFPDEEGATV